MGAEDLQRTFSTAFVEYWSSDDRQLSPGLQQVVDFWFRYHLAKAVIAGTLLVVLVVLCAAVWKAYIRSGGLGAGRRAVLASAGVLATMAALLALAAVMANIQGTLAPFASLFPRLVVQPADGQLTATMAEVRQQLTDHAAAGGNTQPSLTVMISAFSTYHIAMAVISAIVAAALIGLSLVLLKRTTRNRLSDRRKRRVLTSLTALVAFISVAVIMLAVINAMTATDPAPALLALFDGDF